MNLALVHEQVLRALAEADATRHSNAVSYGQTAESRRMVEQWLQQAQDALSHAAAHLWAVDAGHSSHARFVTPVVDYTAEQYHDFIRAEVEEPTR